MFPFWCRRGTNIPVPIGICFRPCTLVVKSRFYNESARTHNHCLLFKIFIRVQVAVNCFINIFNLFVDIFLSQAGVLDLLKLQLYSYSESAVPR